MKIMADINQEEKRSHIRGLIELGKERGYLLYSEINDRLPDYITDPEQLEDFMTV